MKNIIKFGLIAFIAFVAVSCQEEYEVGGTAVEAVAGDYTVHYIHNAGELDMSDVRIYNTASNSATELYVSDEGDFWDYKVKVPVNVADMTFGTVDTVINLVPDYGIKVVLRNGKIMKGAATTPSGVAADSIYFELILEDIGSFDSVVNDYDTLYVGGHRYTGWDEDH